MKRLVIVPTFNEAANIKVIIPRIFKHIQGTSVLVVDDGSPDGTADLVKELQGEYSNLFLEQRESKSGLGSAYRFGFRWGLDRGFEDLIEMDADLSHRVRDLAKMIECKNLDSNIGLIIGSRWVKGGSTINWPKRRKFLSRTANLYVRFMLGMGVNDSTAGFRIYSANLLKKISLDSIKSEGYSFQIEMTRATRAAGAKIVEVPITFRERESGVSKMSGTIVREAMLLVTLWGFKRLFKLP
jgi:dolichol-phosphate mannosyltransferase